VSASTDSKLPSGFRIIRNYCQAGWVSSVGRIVMKGRKRQPPLRSLRRRTAKSRGKEAPPSKAKVALPPTPSNRLLRCHCMICGGEHPGTSMPRVAGSSLEGANQSPAASGARICMRIRPPSKPRRRTSKFREHLSERHAWLLRLCPGGILRYFSLGCESTQLQKTHATSAVLRLK
jgi:hypothetical protein